MLYAAYPLYLVGGDRGRAAAPDARRGARRARGARAGASARRRGRAGRRSGSSGSRARSRSTRSTSGSTRSASRSMLWGVVLLARAARRRARLARDCAARGAAASARPRRCAPRRSCTSWSCGGVACLTLLRRRRGLAEPVARGLAPLAGAAVPLLANEAPRATHLRDHRCGRAAPRAPRRARAVARRRACTRRSPTSSGMNRFEFARRHRAGRRHRGVGRGRRVAADAACRTGPGPRACARSLGAAMLYLVGFGAGLGFVPGLLTASPFAAVGLRWSAGGADVRLVTVMAVVALPHGVVLPVLRGCRPAVGWALHPGLRRVAAGRGDRRARGSPHARSSVSSWWPRWSPGSGSRGCRSARPGSRAASSTIVDRHDQVVISGGQHLLREGGAFYEPGAPLADRRHRRAPAPGGDASSHDAGDTEFAYVVGGDHAAARRRSAATSARRRRARRLPPARRAAAGR